GDRGAVPDGQLLERFVRQRDEAAFKALVARHGPMVLGVCRRLLHDPATVEDAFQATFLVLVRKAGSIRRGEGLGNWLYGVARRRGPRAKVEAARRRAREAAAGARQPDDPLAEMTVRELFEALDEELGHLSPRYRTPLVLCYLEGTTRDQAARELGCSLATLDRRLGRGRELLRARLGRRGLTLSGAVLATALCGRAGTAAVPDALLGSTLQAAAGSAVRAEVAALTKGVIGAMSTTQLKAAAAVLVVVALAGLAAAALGPTASRTGGAGPQ